MVSYFYAIPLDMHESCLISLLGMYFSPEREFLQNSIEFSQRQVDGKVNMMAYKGNAYVTGRSSESSNLYSETESSMDTLEGFSPMVSDNLTIAPLSMLAELIDTIGYFRIHCYPGHSPGEVRCKEDQRRRAPCQRVGADSACCTYRSPISRRPILKCPRAQRGVV